MHRDLSKYKERVYSKVVVYKDRIEFRNVGSLYGENTIEKIKKPEMNVEVRNETLVKLIETLGGVIENRHTGIKTMIDEMKEANLPEPVFRNERDDFVVTFYNGEYPEMYPEELIVKDKAQDEAQDKAQDEAQDDIEGKIIKYCNVERNIYEIMNFIGYKNRTRFRRDYIKPLVEREKLKMTIPDKPTSKNQKYIASIELK